MNPPLDWMPSLPTILWQPSRNWRSETKQSFSLFTSHVLIFSPSWMSSCSSHRARQCTLDPARALLTTFPQPASHATSTRIPWTITVNPTSTSQRFSHRDSNALAFLFLSLLLLAVDIVSLDKRSETRQWDTTDRLEKLLVHYRQSAICKNVLRAIETAETTVSSCLLSFSSSSSQNVLPRD